MHFVHKIFINLIHFLSYASGAKVTIPLSWKRRNLKRDIASLECLNAHMSLKRKCHLWFAFLPIIIIFTLASQHPISSDYRSTRETPFKSNGVSLVGR